MHVCGALLASLTDDVIPEEFVRNRAVSYSSAMRLNKSVVESLSTSIMRVWNPDKSGRPSLDLGNPAIVVQTAIVRMPFESVGAACRDLYDRRSKLLATRS